VLERWRSVGGAWRRDLSPNRHTLPSSAAAVGWASRLV